jgi:hypothetical protein
MEKNKMTTSIADEIIKNEILERFNEAITYNFNNAKKFNSDKELILEMLKQFKIILKDVGKRSQNSKYIVLGVGTLYNCVLNYVAEKLHEGYKTLGRDIRDTITNDIFEYIGEGLRNDREFVLTVLEKCFWVFKFVINEFKNDREFVLEAVKRAVWSLEFASEELRKDKEVVLVAVKRNGYALAYASEELKNDKEVVLEAVKQNWEALEFASEELQNDREVVLEAVKRNDEALQYACQEFMEVFYTSCKISALEYVGNELRSEVVLKAPGGKLQKY